MGGYPRVLRDRNPHLAYTHTLWEDKLANSIPGRDHMIGSESRGVRRAQWCVLVLTLLLLSMGRASAQGSGQQVFHNFALQTGGAGSDIGTAITRDNEGNIYVTGTFQDTVDFDPGMAFSCSPPKGTPTPSYRSWMPTGTLFGQ